MVLFRKISAWYLVIGLVGLAGVLFGQTSEDYYNSPIEQKQFDDERWRKIADDMDYQPEEKDEPSDSGFGFFPSMPLFAEGLIPFVRVVLVVLVGGILAFLLFKLFYKSGWGKGKIKKDDLDLETLDDLEENIHVADLEGLLQKALAEGRFQLAIRIYYLMVIKRLSDLSFINWRKEKTNAAYVYEMQGQDGYQQFAELTREYEKVWYGNRVIDRQKYQTISPGFERFYQELGRYLEQEAKATA